MEKVIDLEERIPSFRERRKRRTNFKFTLLTTIFIIVLLFLLYLQSSISKVQKIVVEGHVLKDEQFYKDTSTIQLNNSMWGFSVKDVEKQLQQLDWVKEADVKRKLLTTITITIDEYQKVAYMNDGDVYYPTLENGYVFEEVVPNMPIDAPIFISFDDETLRKRLLKELRSIDESVLALISQINATPTKNDPYAVTIFMNDGYEIRGDLTTLAEKINYYPSIIAQIESEEQPAKGIIDIEVGTFYQSYEKEYGPAVPIEELEQDSNTSTDSSEEPPTEQMPTEQPSSEEPSIEQQVPVESNEPLNDTSTEGA